MNKTNIFKYLTPVCFGIALAFTFGLSGCASDETVTTTTQTVESSDVVHPVHPAVGGATTTETRTVEHY